MKKPHKKFYRNKYVLTGAAVVIIIIAIIWWRKSSAPLAFETAKAEYANVLETVSVTGTISPDQKADLAFEKSGVISAIYVKVGDRVKKGDPIAVLDSAGDLAALQSAQATLSDMSRSLTPEELAVQESTVESSKTSLNNAIRDALNATHDAFVKAQGAVFNYDDSLFNNPQSANPSINVRVSSYTTQNSINAERAMVTQYFSKWSGVLAGASADNVSDIAAKSDSYLSLVKTFMNDLSVIVNALSPGNSGLSQSAIDADVAAVNSGLSTLNAAIDSVTSAEAALKSASASYEGAQSGYQLKLSGNSAQSIAAQAAKVNQAKAELAKDTVRSPVGGIITRVDPHVGEFIAAGSSGFAVQDSGYKIEAYVPEADIAKVALGNEASSTLDAYGPDVDFPATVTAIDPAETVLEGVPTYKVTLHFDAPDNRIRSGMTANLEILTHEAIGVLTVPYRSVMDDNGGKVVRVVSADGKKYVNVPVVTGLKGSYGNIQIVSGLNDGDVVVTYVK